MTTLDLATVDLWPAADPGVDGAAIDWLRAHDLAPDDQTEIGIDPDTLVLGSLLVDGGVARLAGDADRKAAALMGRIATHKRDELFDAVGGGPFNPASALVGMTGDWDDDDRTVFLIELFTAQPYSPYDVQVGKAFVRKTRRSVAQLVGAEHLVGPVTATIGLALKAHSQVNLARIGLVGAGIALTMGAAGYLAAPAVGAALGSGAGLSGAAAGAHGLAILGGGSLASGGLGMTGGVWMVSGSAAALGGVLGVSSSAAYTMGAAEYRHELIKLQTTYRLVLANQNQHIAIAQAVSAQLTEDAADLGARLLVERELNASNSKRVRDLEAKMVAVEAAIGFVSDRG